PPTRSTSSKCRFFGTCSEPWNIMCSKRCANPVFPSGSFREPTPYQRFTATMGTVRSWDRTTLRPLSRRWRSKGTCNRLIAPPSWTLLETAAEEVGSELVAQHRRGRVGVEPFLDVLDEREVTLDGDEPCALEHLEGDVLETDHGCGERGGDLSIHV